MKKKSKVLLMALCAVLLVATTIMGTIAYLTAEDTVVNTFTVGQVDIELDESEVNPDGTIVDDDGDDVADNRVKENDYHLIPGQSYVKDPTVTVTKGSEESYVRMLVTLNNYSDLLNIYGSEFLPQYFVEGWDNTVWVSTEDIAVDAEADTATYEFRYYTTVNALEAEDDVVLEPLFTNIVCPSDMTGEELALLMDDPSTTDVDEGFKITVVGHAIQQIGFADEDEAWAAFDEQVEE